MPKTQMRLTALSGTLAIEPIQGHSRTILGRSRRIARALTVRLSLAFA